jgi:DNA-binding response OmpR family regulator
VNILLVEDDPGIGRFVSLGLQAEGFSVQWLRSGRRVAASLASSAFAAAILDLGLPDIDGADLCRDLRAGGIDTPICMLTARTTLEDKLQGFRCGADDYVAKPFAFAELLARLAVLVRRSQRGGLLTVGNLSIDRQAHSVTIAGERVTLRPREYDVLLLLAQKVGQTVTRDELLDVVWDGAEITENVVDVYISYVRRRLAGHAGAPQLETVRGAGYRLQRPNDSLAPNQTARGAPGA